MKTFRMSMKAKKFIVNHKDIKPRPLETKILGEINEKVGYRTIYEFLKSDEFAHLSQKHAQFSQTKPRKSKSNGEERKKPKTPQSKVLSDFMRVLNSIHINRHLAQKQTLDEVVGSHSVIEVRKWLLDTFLEALN